MPQSFRTIVKPGKPPFQITHDDRIMTIGSCFSENIGHYFDRYKFQININPFGQQYNPYSVSQGIERLISAKPFNESDLICRDELYHSYDHHSSFSRSNKEETLQHINSNLLHAADFIKSASTLFLTFGTAHFFRLKESGRVVSNCHKMPSVAFDFEMMKPNEIVKELARTFADLRTINPNIKVILTVSPVRYFAFGHFENSVSKGNLFSGIHTLCEQDKSLYYFPAYELVMDDLRDYRFFTDDMLHPNKQAIDYVWEALSGAMLPPSTQTLIKDIEEILAAVGHRSRNPKSEGHIKFVDALMARMEKMEKEWGFDFGAEKKQIQPQSTLSNGGG